VVDKVDKKIELLIGKYIYSGYNIWTTQQLDQTYYVDTRFMGKKCRLKIDHSGEHCVNTSDVDNPNR